MYDTLANNSLAGCTPCSNPKGMGFLWDMVGSCSSERDLRTRTANERNDLRDSQIPSLKKQLEELKKGNPQDQFLKQEKENAILRDKIQTLKHKKHQLELLRDVWAETPDLAVNDARNKEFGLGYRYGLGIRFTCNDYRNEAYSNQAEISKLNIEKTKLEKEIQEIKAKKERLPTIVSTKLALLEEAKTIERDMGSLKNEINSLKMARATRLETEKLAAQKAAMEAERERYRTEAEAKANAAREVADAKINEAKAQADNLRLQLDAKNQQPEKKDGNMNLLLIGGAVLAAAFLLKGGGNKTIIKGRA